MTEVEVTQGFEPTGTEGIEHADLANLKEKLNSAMKRVMKTIDDRLAEVDQVFKNRADDIKDDLDTYFSGIDITTVIRGPALTGYLNDAVAGAEVVIADGFREANFGVNKGVENIQYDYQAALELAIKEFNTGIQSIQEWTEAKSNEVETISTVISEDVSRMHEAFGAKVDAAMESLSGVVSDKNAELADYIETWSKNRPIIHLTGFVQLPSALVKGDNNKFRIGVRNEGAKPWNGWLGLRLILEDEEGDVIGSWDSNHRPGATPSVQPDSSQVFAVDVKVPNEVEPGDLINLFLLVNTI
jgi:exonuclease VII small subunit